MADLSRPGLLGRLVRLVLGVLVVDVGVRMVLDARRFWDGVAPTVDLGLLFLALTLFSGWVVSELLGRSWGRWPGLGMLLVTVTAGLAGALEGDFWGPPLGIVAWVWGVAFFALLGPALVLASVLGTPGCEMRAYADLWMRMKGGDPAVVACPGWIDRLDGVRVMGRW